MSVPVTVANCVVLPLSEPCASAPAPLPSSGKFAVKLTCPVPPFGTVTVGKSAATRERKAGTAALPLEGPAKIVLEFSVMLKAGTDRTPKPLTTTLLLSGETQPSVPTALVVHSPVLMPPNVPQVKPWPQTISPVIP